MKTYLRYWRDHTGSRLNIVSGDINKDAEMLEAGQIVYELRYFEIKEIKNKHSVRTNND